jgi:DinB superfamily
VLALDLLDQLDFQWQATLRPCFAGLTDEQYRWEPVAGCWTIRPTGQMDRAWPAPDPPPFTTISWRLCHLAGAMAERASRHFGDGLWLWDTIFPTTVADAVDFADESYEAWTGPLRLLDDEALARPTGPAEGAFAEHPMSTLVLHLNREVIHHGAEVCLLRDLHRATFGG